LGRGQYRNAIASGRTEMVDNPRKIVFTTLTRRFALRY
jgi:hypothetical protein